MENLDLNWKELCFKENYIKRYVYRYHIMYIFYILDIKFHFFLEKTKNRSSLYSVYPNCPLIKCELQLIVSN